MTKESLIIEVGPLAHGGAFIGVVTSGPTNLIGKKAFVKTAASGETIEAELLKDQKNFIEARLLRVIGPSSQRIEPPCPLFGRCGGCDLQHISLDAQRSAKREMVESMIARQAGLRPSSGVRLIGGKLTGFNYRRRISLHLNEKGELGFYKEESNEVVDLECCLLAATEVNECIAGLKKLLPLMAMHFNAVSIELHAGETFVELKLRHESSKGKLKVPEDVLLRLKGALPNFQITSKGQPLLRQYHSLVQGQSSNLYPAGHFSQVNEEANEVLKETVISFVNSDEVSDLYGGAGNFALPLAAAGRKVALVEADRSLVEHAQLLALQSGLKEDNIKFYSMRCEAFAKQHALRSCVILDPPRAGAKDILQHLAAQNTKRIIYISCNLPSLVRDLKTLNQQGYLLSEVLVLDMFPQTHFSEAIAVLDAA